MNDQPQHGSYGRSESYGAPGSSGPYEPYEPEYPGYGHADAPGHVSAPRHPEPSSYPPHAGPGPLPPVTNTAATTAASISTSAPAGPATSAPPARRPGKSARGDSSPLIAPGLQPAALTTALAGLLAGAAPLGGVPLGIAVALLQAVTAAGWFRLNGMWPARQGIALAFLAGVAADIGLLFADGGHAAVVLIGTLGVWCVLTLALQLRNHAAPDERLYALTAAFTATALTVVAAGLLAALDAATEDAVTVGTAAVAVAALARTLPLPPFVSPGVALLAAAGAGVAVGQLTGLGGPAAATAHTAAGGLLGLAAGGCALIGLRVASYDYPSRFVHLTAGVALPLALAAPAVYLFGRAVA